MKVISYLCYQPIFSGCRPLSAQAPTPHSVLPSLPCYVNALLTSLGSDIPTPGGPAVWKRLARAHTHTHTHTHTRVCVLHGTLLTHSGSHSEKSSQKGICLALLNSALLTLTHSQSSLSTCGEWSQDLRFPPLQNTKVCRFLNPVYKMA
jgi:hypothetical protein